MHRQGFDLQLTQYDDHGWRATFYTTGMEHSPTSATGTGWERTPWHATQRAAWAALRAHRPDHRFERSDFRKPRSCCKSFHGLTPRLCVVHSTTLLILVVR
jgi:hypothetical protein